MFKLYLKITYRNLIKHKSFSLINISGLALGIACCVFILAYIADELSYDKFHDNADQVYRVAVDGIISKEAFRHGVTSSLLGPELQKRFPEVLDNVRIRTTGRRLITYEDKKYYESDLKYVDNSFFNIFSFGLLRGDPETVLAIPNTVVLTESAAKKYFGDEDPIGKILKLDNNDGMAVTGIVKNPPSNSHISFNMLVSFETLIKNDPDQYKVSPGTWMSFNFYTYLLLENGVNTRELESKLRDFSEKTTGGLLRYVGGEMTYFLQPVTDIHLHSNLQSEISGNSDILYVYAFAGIALFVLLIACINFMNLSTARSTSRAKEVGMRKVLGAFRGQLIRQFFGESQVFSLVSLLTALILVEISLPLFNSLSGKNIDINYFDTPWLIAGLLIIAVFVGFAAGSYPALLLSGFRPVRVLRGVVTQGTAKSTFRRLLVVFQFVISITLIIGTNTIYNQIDYMKNKKLGFNKEQLLVLYLRGDALKNRTEFIKDELLAISGVVEATASSRVPGSGSNSNGYLPDGFAGMNKLVIMQTLSFDDDFIKTYGIEIVEGRGFSKEMTTDLEKAALINETTIKKLQWDKSLGKKFMRPADNNFTSFDEYEVVGVFKDFHTQSLYRTIEPTIITYSSLPYNYMTLKLNTENLSQTMELIKNKWLEIDLVYPYEYFFLDESFDSKYRAEERLGSLIRIFTLLAIFIGCLGLFGLASFTAERRTKEIGIRKIFGSSANGIVALLCREFIVLIAVSNIIAWPIAYYGMLEWQRDFPYQADVSIATFVYAAIITLGIAVITVSIQSYKAAYKNPINALRYE